MIRYLVVLAMMHCLVVLVMTVWCKMVVVVRPMMVEKVLTHMK